jgi:hypothetical protein
MFIFVVLPYVNTSYHMLWQFTLISPNPHIIMRKITRDAVDAFLKVYSGEKPKGNRIFFKRGNTIVKIGRRLPCQYHHTAELYLHGHLIAKADHNGLQITNAGYFTNTTKERLNGLPHVHIQQKNFDWYLNGELWDGGWINV